MKLDGQVGPVQSHDKDFVLYSKGSGRALMFLRRDIGEESIVEWEAMM